MPAATNSKKTKNKAAHARLTPFSRGVAYGLSLAGYSVKEIADEIEKPGGCRPSKSTIFETIATARKSGGLGWDGVVVSNAGRPRKTEDALNKDIVKLVFKNRGSLVVTAKFVRKMLKAARTVSVRTLQRRIGEAGLAWLRRRRKSLVPSRHKAGRLAWAAWVLSRRSSSLARWAYSDGTVFYLARSHGEEEDKQRAALGPFVWRSTDGSDALYEDCVGPSQYWKGQGVPIRIWGLLLAGTLFITVLPKGATMNRWWYEWVVDQKFPGWIRKMFGRSAKKGVFLVQDHERCLWKEEPLEAMRQNNITLLENYPRCSQDLNAIENAWREVRARLDCTAPATSEARGPFIRRARAAVAWVNKYRRAQLLEYCNSQSERALAVQEATPPGARTKY
jgi:transposase